MSDGDCGGMCYLWYLVARWPLAPHECLGCVAFAMQCAARRGCPCHPPVIMEGKAGMYGWGENASKDVYVSGESCTGRQRTRVRPVQQSEPPYELRSLVTRMEQREVGK